MFDKQETQEVASATSHKDQNQKIIPKIFKMDQCFGPNLFSKTESANYIVFSNLIFELDPPDLQSWAPGNQPPMMKISLYNWFSQQSTVKSEFDESVVRENIAEIFLL